MADSQAAVAELSKAQKAVKALLKLKVAAIFSAPVSEEEVPGYGLVIQNPIDLGTVLEKLKNGEYASAGKIRRLTQLTVGLQLHDHSKTAIQYRYTYAHTHVSKIAQVNINIHVVCKYDAVAKALAILLLRGFVLHTIVLIDVCHAAPD